MASTGSEASDMEWDQVHLGTAAERGSAASGSGVTIVPPHGQAQPQMPQVPPMAQATAPQMTPQQPMAPQLPVVHPPHTRPTTAADFAAAAAMVIDLKGLWKPAIFSGCESDWAEWRFRQSVGFQLIGLEDLTRLAERSLERDLDHGVVPRETEAASLFLHSLLVQTCTGKALTIVRMAGHNGLIAWKRLANEYEPRQAMRSAAMLTGLLNPRWDATRDFSYQWLEWERQLSFYEDSTGSLLPDEIKCATILRWAPAHIRDFLRSCPVDCMSDYATLRTQLRLYFLRNRTFDSTGAARYEGPGSSIDEVVAWLKGKGRGFKGFKGQGGYKGKGKGYEDWSKGGYKGFKGKGDKGKKGGKGKEAEE